MTRNYQRPGSFTVRYHDQKIRFTRYRTERKEEGGYAMVCPKHGTIIHIETDSGKHHSLVFKNRRPTIRASILCRAPTNPNGAECGWHVFVTDGVATDA